MIVVVIARVVLVAVFATAGIAKLLDRPSTRRSLVDFGVPEALAPVGTWALAGSELLVAGLLLGSATTAAGAALALVLLVCFCVAAGINLAKGRAPECNCFGQVHSEPVGPQLLVRNVALAGAAIVVLVGARTDPGPDLWAWAGDLSTAEAVLAGAVAALAVAVAALTRRIRSLEAAHRELATSHRALAAHLAASMPGAADGRSADVEIERAATTAPIEVLDALDATLGEPEAPPAPVVPTFPPGLPIGTSAPGFALEAGDGELALTDLLAPGKPLVLLFVAPTCGTCHELIPKPVTWAATYGDVLSFALVTAGSREANDGIGEPSGGFEPILFDPGTARSAYEVAATPGGVLISPDGTIETETVYGVAEIAMLVMRAAATRRAQVPPLG